MVIDPVFWLGLSILLVAVSLTAVLMAALPAIQEIARAARSVEKLAETLNRELPPTLQAIRLTGLEITELTDEVSEGVQKASNVVKQVDQSISGVKKQTKIAHTTTKRVVAGFKAAWRVLMSQPKLNSSRTSNELLPPAKNNLEIEAEKYETDPIDDYNKS